MNDRVLMVATMVATLGCGLVGGAFFAFSTFVMKALGRLAPPQGIAAMQSINIVVINPWFMTALFGTAALCAVLTGWAAMHWQQPGAGYFLSGGLTYLLGTVLVTIAFHVPRNNALATVDPNTATGVRLWENYVSAWTTGNHVRTAAAVVAMALLIVGLLKRVP